MTELADLHARVLAEPADDAVRFVYADALTEAGDPRGEFIAVQCTLAAAGIFELADLVAADVADTEVVRLAGLLRRANQLLAKHSRAWTIELLGAGLDGTCWIDWRRGMPDVAGVESPYVGGELARALDRTTITTLEISKASSSALAALAHDPPRALRGLVLGWPHLDDDRALATLLAKLPALERFAIQYPERDLRIDVRATLSSLAGLRELELDRIRIDRKDLDALADLPCAANLRRLNLAYCGSIANSRIDDGALDLLDGRLPALDEADLGGLDLAAATVARMTTLVLPRVLVLRTNALGDAGVEQLMQHPAIAAVEAIDLSNAQVGDAGVRAIARCTALGKLRRLALSDNAFGDTGAIELAAAASARLRTLELGRSRVGIAGVRALLASDRHALATLTYRPSDDAVDGVELARAIAGEPRAASLRALSLTDVQLGDVGAAILATAPSLAGLRALVLPDTAVNTAGAHALAHSTQPLVQIDLASNHTRDRGARAWIEGSLPALVMLDPGPIDDPSIHAAIYERFGRGVGVYRMPDAVREPIACVLFSTRRIRLTPTRIRDAVTAVGGLELAGSYRSMQVRDPRAPDAHAITITVSHAVTNLTTATRVARGPRAAEIAGFEGLLTLACRPADRHDLAPAALAIATAIAGLTRGVVHDIHTDRLIEPAALPRKR